MGIADIIKNSQTPSPGRGSTPLGPPLDPITGALGAAASAVVGAATGAMGTGSMVQALQATQNLQGAERLRNLPGMLSKPTLPPADSELARLDEASSSALVEMLSNKANEQSIRALPPR